MDNQTAISRWPPESDIAMRWYAAIQEVKQKKATAAPNLFSLICEIDPGAGIVHS
jgi:hypothetical protein